MLFMCILYFRDLFQDANFEYLIQSYSNLMNSGTNWKCELVSAQRVN